MNIELTNYTVTIKDGLTWGDKEQVTTTLASGVKLSGAEMSGYDAKAMLEAKYKLLELTVLAIKDKGGKDVPYSREWMNALPANDGDKLFEAVDAISKKK